MLDTVELKLNGLAHPYQTEDLITDFWTIENALTIGAPEQHCGSLALIQLLLIVLSFWGHLTGSSLVPTDFEKLIMT